MRNATTPLIRTLASSALAKGLTEGQVLAFYDMTTPAAVESGQFLFHEGALADCLIVITEGTVEVVKKTRVLATLGPGEVLGEVSVFDVQQTRTASIRAKTSVRYLKVSALHFKRMLARDDVSALKVVANLAQQMCKRLTVANEKLVESPRPTAAAQAVQRIGW